MAVSFSPQVGDRIADRFELDARLRGQGTVRVFSAHDRLTDRAVAIVLVDPERARANAWGAFAGIVATLARARIAGLVLPQVGSAVPKPPYCVEEPQALRGFDRWRDQGPLPWQRALGLGERAAAILGEAYAAAGVAHRALTPSRCATTPSDDVRVLDYGVAELEGDRPDDSGYRAPEQQPGGGDARSDVYSLGLILFELITGRSWAGAAPPSLRSCATVPRHVDEFFARVLARDPAQRHADVAAMRAAMRALLETAAEPRAAAPAIASGVMLTARRFAAPAADRTEIVASSAADRTQVTVPAVPAALKAVDRTEIVAATPKPADRTEIVAATPKPADRTEIVVATPKPADRTEIVAATPKPADRTEIVAATPVDRTEIVAATPAADRTEILAASPPAGAVDRTEIVRPGGPRSQSANATLRPAATQAEPQTERVPASPLVPSDTTLLLPAAGPTAAPPQPVREPTAAPPDPLKKALIWINVVCFTAILLVLCVRLLT